MNAREKEMNDRSIEDYQSYLITNLLKGRRCPSREGVVRLINAQRKVKL